MGALKAVTSTSRPTASDDSEPAAVDVYAGAIAPAVPGISVGERAGGNSFLLRLLLAVGCALIVGFGAGYAVGRREPSTPSPSVGVNSHQEAASAQPDSIAVPQHTVPSTGDHDIAAAPSAPSSQPVSQQDLPKLALQFTSPGPVAHGLLRNDSQWTITRVEIALTRSYVREPATIESAKAPSDTTQHYELVLPAPVSPFSTSSVTVDIGNFLASYYDRGWNPPQAFRASSRVRIASASGFSR